MVFHTQSLLAHWKSDIWDLVGGCHHLNCSLCSRRGNQRENEDRETQNLGVVWERRRWEKHVQRPPCSRPSGGWKHAGREKLGRGPVWGSWWLVENWFLRLSQIGFFDTCREDEEPHSQAMEAFIGCSRCERLTGVHFSRHAGYLLHQVQNSFSWLTPFWLFLGQHSINYSSWPKQADLFLWPVS